MKRCTKCGQEKPETEFYRDKRVSSGLRSDCKVCHDQKQNAYREEHPEEASARSKAWSKTKRGREFYRDYRQKARANGHMVHQEKAHNAVEYAIRTGKMVRLPCIICGDPKSHGHHEDYSKPLDVVWLCPGHHKARHMEIEAEKKTADWPPFLPDSNPFLPFYDPFSPK